MQPTKTRWFLVFVLSCLPHEIWNLGKKTIPEIWLGRMFLGRGKPTWEKTTEVFWVPKIFLAKFLASKMLVVWGVFSSLRAFGRLEFSSMVFGCLGEDGWDVDGLEIRPLHRLRWRILPVFYRVSLISQVVNAGFLKHQQYLLDSKMFCYHFSLRFFTYPQDGGSPEFWNNNRGYSGWIWDVTSNNLTLTRNFGGFS